MDGNRTREKIHIDGERMGVEEYDIKRIRSIKTSGCSYYFS